MATKTDIAIYLPDAEAAQFLLFQEHFETFSVMLKSGVFAMRGGNVVLHFDHNGVLQNISRADTLYSRKHA